MKSKKYKEPLKEETETTINILYSDNILSIYTNKVSLQKKICKVLGEPNKEHKIKNKTTGSFWDVSLNDKVVIEKLLHKVNIFECMT